MDDVSCRELSGDSDDGNANRDVSRWMAALLEGQLPPATDSSLRAAVSVAVSPCLQDGSTVLGAGQTAEEAD